MGRNTKVLPLSVPPDLIAELDKIAKVRKMNRSKLCVTTLADFAHINSETYERLVQIAAKRQKTPAEIIKILIDKFPLDDDTIKPIALKVPTKVLSDKEMLKSWLDSKVTALVNLFFPET